MPTALRRCDDPRDRVATEPTMNRSGARAERAPRTPPGLAPPVALIGGRYQIVGPVGHGGMGEVVAAHDQILGRAVAIKRTRLRDRDGRLGRRLRREARIAARVAHRAIVGVYDLVHDATGDHLVMELVAGPALVELHDAGAMAPREVVRLGLELAEALAAIHARGIVHLDLKLENVVMTADGQPKLTDFGSAACPAERLDDDDDELSGTPRVMSPEHIRGQPLDGRADLYSLGVLLFELLTATSPFVGATPVETLARVLGERAARVDARVDGVPAALVQLVADLLEKDPQVRPATAGEVLTRLWAIVPELPA